MIFDLIIWLPYQKEDYHEDGEEEDSTANQVPVRYSKIVLQSVLTVSHKQLPITPVQYVATTKAQKCSRNYLMKKSRDPRHLRRIQIVKDLFAYSFASRKNTQKTSGNIISKLTEVDKYIAKAAPDWPLEKVAKIDLAVLRLAVFEIVIDNKEPVKVIIDEAVEIAKAFGNEKSSSFINGVLGTIIKLVQKENG